MYKNILTQLFQELRIKMYNYTEIKYSYIFKPNISN